MADNLKNKKDIENKEIELGSTLLHHGCKDGSLSEEVIKNYDYFINQ